MAKRQFCLYFAAAGVLSFAAVFALFTVARPRCYPKKVMKMSSTDMRLASSVSSFWCESLELSCEHPFLAFKLSKEPSISPLSLSRNEVDLKLTLKLSEIYPAQYYLLPGTMMTTLMCSALPGATMYVLKGRDIQNFKQESNTFASDENDEDSSKDQKVYSEEHEDSDEEKQTVISIMRSNASKFQKISASNINGVDCEFSPSSQLFQLNVTSSDTYFVIVRHEGPALKNFVKVRLFLDRTTYNVDTDVSSVHVCGGSLFTSSCSVPLDFLSKDRVVIKIPGEPGAGLATFKMRSSCKPRFSLVTVISLTIPFVLFTFSLLLVIYMKQSAIRSRLSKHDADSVSTLASPLLKSSVSEGHYVSDIEQNLGLQMSKPDKEVGLLAEFPEAIPRHCCQSAQEIPQEPPPSYK